MMIKSQKRNVIIIIWDIIRIVLSYFLLQSAHFLYYVYRNAYYRIVRLLSDAKDLYEKGLFRSDSTTTSILSVDRSSSSNHGFEKIPKHIAFSFSETPISYRDVAILISWSADLRIPYISLYDVRGVLKSKLKEIESALKDIHTKKDRIVYHWLSRSDSDGNDTETDTKGEGLFEVFISVLSHQDGKPEIIKSAQEITEHVLSKDVQIDQLEPERIDDYLLTKINVPEPNVLIRFGLIESNLGFLPWQIRLTEIHDIFTHRGVRYREFIDVMTRYSECQQRFGA